MALLRGEYSVAEALTAGHEFPAIQAELEHLNRDHGGLHSYEGGDTLPLPPSQRAITHTKWTWNDGFVRCLRIQETQEGQVALLDSTFQECDERNASFSIPPDSPPRPK